MDWLDIFSAGSRPMTPYGALQGQPAPAPAQAPMPMRQGPGAPLPTNLSAIHAFLASPVGDVLLQRLSDPGPSLYDLGNRVLSMAQPQVAASPPQSVAGQAMGASTGSDLGYSGPRYPDASPAVRPATPNQYTPRQQAPQGGGGYYQSPVPEHIAPPAATLGVPPVGPRRRTAPKATERRGTPPPPPAEGPQGFYGIPTFPNGQSMPFEMWQALGRQNLLGPIHQVQFNQQFGTASGGASFGPRR